MIYSIERALARYVVEDPSLDIAAVWKRMTAMFAEGERCWLRPFLSFTPQASGTVRPGSAFEATGSAGGQYPITITEWNPKTARFTFREGPATNPPSSVPSSYCGATYAFQIVQEGEALVVDASDSVQYRNLKAGETTTDPVKVLEWVLQGFAQIPLPGKTVVVHAA